MNRRDLIASLMAAATTRVAVAEEPTKTYRLAIVGASLPVPEVQRYPPWRLFLEELRRLGYVEGKNLVIGWYSAEAHIERYPQLVLEVVQWNPDLILSGVNSLTHAFIKVTRTIPIVGGMIDPVGDGLAASLARPGGNITGYTSDAGIELMGKYLEMLKEIVPSASKFAYLAPVFRWEAERSTLLEAARQLGVSLVGIPVDSPFKETDFRRAFATIVQERADALMVGYAGQFRPSYPLIVELARQNRLPAIYTNSNYMDAGGLLAYVPEVDGLIIQMAHQADQIFKGANPGDIPIQRATTYRLIINIKAAKGLGLTIPQPLLVRADQVIE
jgi:putative ABC transport system substrate-binding protein